jgi:hypothetical protein
MEQRSWWQHKNEKEKDEGSHSELLARSFALAPYEKTGFQRREPFADYRPDPLSVFMERQL